MCLSYISRLQVIKTKRSGIIFAAADILLRNIPRRMELNEEMVAAAILDPSIQHFDLIDEWLRVKRLTRTELLEKIIQKFDIDISKRLTQHQLPIEQPDVRLRLLQKHSSLTRSNDSLDSELFRFGNIKEQISDVLDFWRKQEINFPLLSQIARVIICKPATSAKSESAFSMAGSLICKKRANIDPLRAQKILFVHDNYELLKCDEF